MITVLQLTALSNTNEVLLVTTDESGQKRFLEIDRISPLLEPLNPSLFQHKKLLHGGVNNPISINIDPDIIYNSVCDPDRCSKALHIVQKAAKENPFPFVNHPDLIDNLREDKLYELSKDIDGLLSPKCIRATPHSLSELQNILQQHAFTPPFLVKEAGTEPELKNQYLFKEGDDFHLLERFAFDGRAYYIKKFHDYSSEDTLFRKYRFFIIGNKILPAHLIVSKQWKVSNDHQAHQDIRDINAILKEEKEFLKRYQKKRTPPLIKLQKKLQLDFYAVDCAINPQGELLLFGIDGAAHYSEDIKDDGYYTAKQIERYNEAVETMLINKLKAGNSHHA